MASHETADGLSMPGDPVSDDPLLRGISPPYIAAGARNAAHLESAHNIPGLTASTIGPLLANYAPDARVDVRPSFSLAPPRLVRFIGATVLRRTVWTPVDGLTTSEARRINWGQREGEETRIALAEQRRRSAGQKIMMLLALHRPDYQPSSGQRTNENSARQWLVRRASRIRTHWRSPRQYARGSRRDARDIVVESDHSVTTVHDVMRRIEEGQVPAVVPRTRRAKRAR